MNILKIQSWTGLDGSVDRIWPAGRQLIITDVDHVVTMVILGVDFAILFVFVFVKCSLPTEHGCESECEKW